MTPASALASSDAVIAAGVRPPPLPASTPALELDAAPALWPARAEHFLAAHIRWASQRLAVLTAGDESEAERAVLDACARHYETARISQHTVEQLAAQWARNFLLTLRRDPPWATAQLQPWQGLPVFVVAAGPSLDGNGHLLRDAQRVGPVLAVNTSASACLHHGVTPDACVCCEAKDVASHLLPLRGKGVPVALSANASEANWAACERPWGFVGHEPALVPYALALGCPPLHYGGSVACAAVSLAIQWGASEVVLVGQDLCYTGGRLYAQGTPFEDLRAEVRDGVVHVTGSSKQRHPAPVVWRDGWGGGEPVASVREMDGFAGWLAKAAGVLRVTNATQGGARIAGCREETLASVIARCDVRDERTAGAGLSVWRSQRLPGVTRQLVMDARACLEGDACMPTAGLSLLHMYCVPVVLGWHRGLSLRQRKATMRAAMERGCREILEVLE